ncbi:hypothetical protein V6N12_054683 [Hibiscus sabdariffa]|uniref:Uncharacterized protein n=1 Tax=Hibiscus sabdariffa TaxID=183260 RepID=A0ABR2D3Y8_9ROSI
MSSRLNQRHPSQDSGRTSGNQRTAAAISHESRELLEEKIKKLTAETVKYWKSLSILHRILTEKIEKLTAGKTTLMNKIRKLKAKKMKLKKEMKKLDANTAVNTKSTEMLAAQYNFLSQSIGCQQPDEQTPTPNRQLNLLNVHRPLETVVIDVLEEKRVTLDAPKEWRENLEGFRHSSGQILTQNRQSYIATKKMVVKVTFNSDKSRYKALRIAVGLSGVESASLKGDDKSRIELTGHAVDLVKLTSLLRKNVGHAEMVSIADYVSTPYYPQYYYHPVPSYGYVEDHEPSCSIMQVETRTADSQ